MSRDEDDRPRAERIAANLRAQIMAGDLPAGRQLPTTDALMTEHDTSNVTVQRALGILKREGFLVGKPGLGVFVRETQHQTITPASYMAPSEAGEPYRWITEATKRSQVAGARILKVAEVEAPARVAEVLGVEQGAPAVLRVRLGLLDDQPAEMTHSYYPVELARGTRLAARRKVPGGSPTLLADLGYPPREQEDEIATRPATSEEYMALELPGDVPILEIFRVVYSDKRRPIEVTVLVKPGHLFKMGYHLPVH